MLSKCDAIKYILGKDIKGTKEVEHKLLDFVFSEKNVIIRTIRKGGHKVSQLFEMQELSSLLQLLT